MKMFGTIQFNKKNSCTIYPNAMASLLAYASTFCSCHRRHPSSTITSQISHPLLFGSNNHIPDKRHSKKIFRKGTNATKNYIFSPKSKLLFGSTQKRIVALGTGTAIFLALAFTGDCYAAGIESQVEAVKALITEEPKNALSLPTWAIHVSSVVEWIVAMALVWQYGDKPGYQAWKGLSWGMVPLLGGAFCACTWHFFYNAESLEILVALQGALTVIGNFTMLVAAFRIYESTKGGSETS